MDDVDEIYAACIVEYVRRDPSKVRTGPFYWIGKEARDAFNLPYSEKIFKGAIGILEDIGVLKRYQRSGMQTYYRVDANDFAAAMKSGPMGIKAYAIGRNFTDGRTHSFLEAFADIGSDYLREALDNYEEQILALAEANEAAFVDEEVDADGESRPVESSTWTGRAEPKALSNEQLRVLVKELDSAESQLERLDVSQEVRAQARAYILASRLLAEAPDPPVELIWSILTRANSLAGIASLFVSIFALFSTAAH
jgi:hypothetical protein